MSNPFSKPKYLEKFGLKENPYSTNPDERYLYPVGSHEEAINLIARTIENREGAALVMGIYGTGKTTLLRRVASLLKMDIGQFTVGVIETARHSPSEFQLTKEILESFGESCVGRDTKTRIDQLKTSLFNNYKNGKTAVLLIDEAHEFKAKIFEVLRGFLNFESPQTGKLLQIILFAQPVINKKLIYAKAFRSRLTRTVLKVMSKEECEKMLRWRFSQAGGLDFPITKDGIEELWTLSKGNPRVICGLAGLGLEIAGVRDSLVTRDIITAVSETKYLE